MKYKIFSSMYEDIDTGAVWISGATYPPRTIVKIRCTETRKSVYTEALLIEPNFLKKYNHPPRITIADTETALVMNNWYRHLLGDIQSKNTYDFDISIPTDESAYWGRLRATMTHPQLAIRVGTWIGIIAVLISVLIPASGKMATVLGEIESFWSSIVGMSASGLINLIAALFGVLGTILLFKGSFAFESIGSYANPVIIAQMNSRNRRRDLLQRLGLFSLLIGFSLQAVSQFLS